MTGYDKAPEARKLPVSLKESPKLKIALYGPVLGLETTFSWKPKVKEVMTNKIWIFIVFL